MLSTDGSETFPGDGSRSAGDGSRRRTVQIRTGDESKKSHSEGVVSVASSDNLDEIDMEFGSSRQGNRSGDLNFDFMEESSTKQKAFWSRMFGHHQDENSQRFNAVIYGSGVASKSGFSSAAVLFPWFSERYRARQDFITEMRVLSRLRHPVSQRNDACTRILLCFALHI